MLESRNLREIQVVSDAINEAYARIDVSMIQQLQNKVEELSNLITTGHFARFVDGSGSKDVSVKATAVYAERKFLAAKDDTLKINFNGIFDDIPVITATVRDTTGDLQKLDSVTILMTESTKQGAEFFIKRSKNIRCGVHIIAIGPAAATKSN